MEYDKLILEGYISEKTGGSFEKLLMELIIRHRDSMEELRQIYASLCNVVWYNTDDKVFYTCSWRYAGNLISGVVGGSYTDYYCSGGEGLVAGWLALELRGVGWLFGEW